MINKFGIYIYTKIFLLSHETTSSPAWKVDFCSADTRPNADNLAVSLSLRRCGLLIDFKSIYGLVILLFTGLLSWESDSLHVAKILFFFSFFLLPTNAQIVHLTGIESPSVISEAIVSGDNLLEPGGGVFRLISRQINSSKTLRESDSFQSSHDLSFNVSPLLLLCTHPL